MTFDEAWKEVAIPGQSVGKSIDRKAVSEHAHHEAFRSFITDGAAGVIMAICAVKPPPPQELEEGAVDVATHVIASVAAHLQASFEIGVLIGAKMAGSKEPI